MMKRSALKEARHNAILDAATELLVKKPRASLNEIAHHAGVGIATLHRYFHNRDHLIRELGLRAIQVVHEKMAEIPKSQEGNLIYLETFVKVLIPLGDKIFFLMHEYCLEENEEVVERERDIKHIVQTQIDILQEKKLIRTDLTSEWIVETLYFLLFMAWQQVNEKQLSEEHAAHTLLTTIFNGIVEK